MHQTENILIPVKICHTKRKNFKAVSIQAITGSQSQSVLGHELYDKAKEKKE